MTAQIPDTLLLQDQSLFIVGVNGSGLFDPYALGLKPRPRITSCWRGYVCEYKVLTSQFLLNKLQVNLDAENPVSINGVKADVDTHGLFSHIYKPLNLQIDFTGGILAGERVIYRVNSINTSFSEMMGLPNDALDTVYWLPWYNNVDLDTQLRFGVP